VRVVGLTGGMGAGKSTVARLLAAHGAYVIDADAIARAVVAPGTPGLNAITKRFGPDVIDAEGAMDRAAVASIVFSDPASLRALEAITHPAIRESIAAQLRAHADAEHSGNERVVVLDHPLLVETGLAADLEAVVVVTAPVELRVARLAAGRGIAESDARARIASQASDEERAAAATHVVSNAGDASSLSREVNRLWQALHP
jgi:dephospho-CoA kinase